MDKTCNICKIAKRDEFFYSSKNGLSSKCKDCFKQYHLDNREKRLKQMKEYTKSLDQDALKIYRRQKQLNYKQKNPLKHKEIAKKTRLKNREKRKLYEKNRLKERQIYLKNRRKNNPLAYLADTARNRLLKFLKQRSIVKTKGFNEYIGCTIQELKIHLEKQFRDGMTWENRGKYWHMDHIIPLASAKTEEEIYKLCHYTNIQPLTVFENLSKGAKIVSP